MSEQDLPYLIIAIVGGLFLLFVGIVIFFSVINFFGGLFLPELREQWDHQEYEYKMRRKKEKDV